MKKPNIKIYRDYEIERYEDYVGKWWVVNEDSGVSICVATKERANYLKKNYDEWDYKSEDFIL